MPLQAWGGYFLGSACILTHLLLLGTVFVHGGKSDDLLTFAIAYVLFSMTPALVVCLGLFYGALVTAPLEALFGVPRTAANATHPLTLGFQNGALTVLPALAAVLFEFGAGQAWARAETRPPNILGETLRGVVFLAALWLHQTVLLLLLARFRAARQGGTPASPTYLRLLCLLSFLIFGILVATLISASQTP